MKIALIGYGAMGKLIRTLAEEKGHEIAVVIETGVGKSLSISEGSAGALEPSLTLRLPPTLKNCDVAIDFTNADAVRGNVKACVAAGVPLVEGTTGWNGERNEIERIVTEGNGAMVFAANFSIGVNLFYRIADHAAELLAKFPEYEAFIEEQHHSRKKDVPSGTALKLKDIVAEHVKNEFSVSSSRAGNIPGTHRVGFDGAADQIMLEHTARSREGFASGALMAAEWIVEKTGFYEFADVMDEVLGKT